MRINHNISALNAWQSLGQTDSAMSKSLERLSSGLRINRASDDAAGLAISEKMRGQIRGLNQAVRNSQDAISLIQTAEGALNETHSILQRMRELAVQSSTDTNTPEDRKEIQEEMNQLATELSRIADTTEFNTKELLNGTFKGVFHIGANKGQNMTLEIGAMGADDLKVSGSPGAKFAVEADLGENALDGTIMAGGGSFNVVKLDENQYGLANAEGEIVALSDDGGKKYSVLESAVAWDNVENAEVAEDVAIEFSDPVISDKVVVDTEENKVTAQATVEAKGLAAGEYEVVEGGEYLGADTLALADEAGNLVAFSSDGEKWYAMGADEPLLEVNEAFENGDRFTVGAGEGIDVSTQKAADAAIETIQDALNIVSEERSKLGAVQNRLEHTINNLGVAAENLTAAESRIRDVDMAQEIMEFTKNQILIQAGTAMLANANVRPQSVLQLLG